ncbi:hypothetical protein TVAG_000260 [Trichomonas vaginalis G3]|uniref:Wntless-like transmembrane domain-containing protein n=1 Tax=Trichomonas vaginalis (strain ATCC PRA-98 / G3) TaxID=412133 RepID=A2FFY7_TRIV3|nr:transmembrane protein 181 family [Trichomonas vaginalis G3]EAX96197.1 hypothetical protein TVAG_000260 [Trichomonas vaginalis G3]KAI5506293.1 transmembrane protein 181 family [Trichomonas vaginalis G3]|eukprot:XP_001309127.1 hypothetical protein [Trichomonas vaginalis G3]
MIDNMHSSSGEMIDIQIEESLGRETLMAIDSANFRDEIYSIGGFVVILIISTLTGFFGPKPFDVNEKTIYLRSSNEKGLIGTKAQDFSMTIKEITPYFKFVSFQLIFNRENTAGVVNEQIAYNYKVVMKKNNEIVKTVVNYDDNTHLIAFAGNEETYPIILYTQKLLNFDSIHFECTIDVPPMYTSLTLRFVHGFTQYTIFQIYFKLIFALIELIFLVLFVLRLSTAQFKYWHLEQKLTCPLLLLSFLYNNIFEFFFVKHKSNSVVLLEILVNSLFSAYLKFFILVLFDSLRYKNRKTDKCFFVPKIILCSIIYLADVVSEIGFTVFDKKIIFMAYFNIVLFCGYIVWCIFCIIVASIQVDITERYKYIIYLVSGSVSIALIFLYGVIFSFLPKFKDSALRFVGVYSIQNVFVLLMAYFHWPYEVLHDQDYVNGDNAQEGATPAEFFVNDESN